MVFWFSLPFAIWTLGRHKLEAIVRTSTHQHKYIYVGRAALSISLEGANKSIGKYPKTFGSTLINQENIDIQKQSQK